MFKPRLRDLVLLYVHEVLTPFRNIVIYYKKWSRLLWPTEIEAGKTQYHYPGNDQSLSSIISVKT